MPFWNPKPNPKKEDAKFSAKSPTPTATKAKPSSVSKSEGGKSSSKPATQASTSSTTATGHKQTITSNTKLVGPGADPTKNKVWMGDKVPMMGPGMMPAVVDPSTVNQADIKEQLRKHGMKVHAPPSPPGMAAAMASIMEESKAKGQFGKGRKGGV